MNLIHKIIAIDSYNKQSLNLIQKIIEFGCDVSFLVLKVITQLALFFNFFLTSGAMFFCLFFCNFLTVFFSKSDKTTSSLKGVVIIFTMGGRIVAKTWHRLLSLRARVVLCVVVELLSRALF